MRPLFEDETPIKTPEPSTAKPSSPEVKVINMSSSDECIRKERDVEKPDESPVKKIEIAVQTALEPTCPAENKDVQVELPEQDMHVPHPSRDATARVSDPIESTITPEMDDGNNNLTSSENGKMIVEIDEKEVIITSKKRKISVTLSKQPSSQIYQKVHSTSVNSKVTSPMKRFSRSQSDSCLTSQEKTKCLDTPGAATIRVDIHMNEFAQDEIDASQETRVSVDASAESSQTVSGPNDEDQSTEQSSSKVCIYKNSQCKLLHMKLDDIHDYALKNCTERLQKYQDLQNLYTERIASLTDLIEKVRNEQKDMDFSLISPSDNTSLMQISTPKSSCNDAQAVRRWSDPIEAIHALLGRTLLESQRIMRGSEAASRNETLCDAEIQAIISTPRSKLVDTVKTHVQESKVVEGRAEPKINSNEKFNIHLSQVEMQQKPQARSATKTSGRDFYPLCIFSLYEKEVVEKLKNMNEILKQSENLDKASTDFVALKKNDESQNRVSSFKELDPKESASLNHEKDNSITEELASTSGTAKENDFIPIVTGVPCRETEFVEKLNNLDEIIKQSENLDKASTAFVALKKTDKTLHRVSSFKELDLKESASLKREKDDSITEELASTSGTAKENDFIPIVTGVPCRETEFVEKLNNLDEIIKQSENLDKASTAFVALKKNDETQHRVSSFKELDLKESASLKREKDDSITEELASTSGTAKENDFIPILTEIPKISRSGNVTSISARPKFPVISLNRLDRKKKEMDEVMEYFQEKKVREKKKKKVASEESEDDEVDFILYRKKKELDDLVMKCLQEKKDGEKEKKKAASEESKDDEAEEKDGSEEEEEEEKKLAKRNYIKKTPNKRKKESSDDEESASASDDDTSDEDYTPQKSYYISKKSKLGKKGKKKGRGKNKKTPGSTAKKGDSDKDKGYFTLTPELAAVVGVKQMRCYEVVREIWSILKKRNLFDPEDKRYAFCDDELLRVFGEKRILAFGMMKYLKNHMKLKHKSL